MPAGPSPVTNTQPQANAGLDQQVIYPLNTCLLVGSAVDKENNIQKTTWSKISGPTSFFIETPDSLSTYVRNLEQGVYKFELTVKDSFGLMSKDTTTVTVNPVSSDPGEVILRNLAWGKEGLNGTLLWGSAIIIRNVFQYVPPGNVFKVFIRRDSSSNWEELLFGEHSWYGLYLVNGILIIWSGVDEKEPIDIKLVY